VQVIHAAPGTAAVDVRVGTAHTFSGVSYGSVSGYDNLLPDTYTVQVVAAGTTGPVLAETTLEALLGSDYTLAVAGEPGSLEVRVIVDENVGPAGPSGQASLRVVHLSPDAGAVDVALAGRTDPLFSNVSFGGVTDPQGVEAGTPLGLVVREAGTTTTLLNVPATTLEENRIYTLFLLGRKAGAPALQGLVSLDAEPGPRLRALHAVAGGDEYDVLIDGVRVFSNLPFGWHSQYVVLEPGAHTVQVVPTGETSPIILETTVDLTVDTFSTLVAGGQAGAAESWWLTDDNRLPGVGKARVRFVHASPDAPAVDVVVSSIPLFEDVAYKEVGDYVALDAGTYDLVVREAGTGNVLASLSDVTLDEGNVYSLALVGLADGTPARQLVTNRDLIATQRTVQASYVINRAQTGEWKVKLGGYINPHDKYQLSVIGAKPEPTLTEVQAVSTGPTSGEVTYRMVADRPGTLVSIYANSGPITITQTITDTEGITQTVTVPHFEGVPLVWAQEVPFDGALQTVPVDFAGLRSGYAPDPVQVVSPWQATWQANIQTVPSYGTIEVSWDACSNADVDGYAIYVGGGSLAETQVYTVGGVLESSVPVSEAGQTYSLSIGAYREGSGDEARSEEVAVVAAVADFTVTPASADITLVGGDQTTVDLTFATALDPYPTDVGLYLVSVPEGLGLELSLPALIPTTGGVVVQATVSAAEFVEGGTYPLVFEALGGGVRREVTRSGTGRGRCGRGHGGRGGAVW